MGERMSFASHQTFVCADRGPTSRLGVFVEGFHIRPETIALEEAPRQPEVRRRPNEAKREKVDSSGGTSAERPTGPDVHLAASSVM